MSSSLYWKITPPDTEALDGCDHPLKGIIAERFFDGNYSSPSDRVTISWKDDKDLVNFLKGFLAGNDDPDISTFLKDLEQHRKLDVWIER